MSEASSARITVRRDVLLIVVATAILFTLALGARDLWNPNEPIYGRATVEMEQRGDWLTPTVNGIPFTEKPILYYWMARLAGTLGGGVDELTLRLPSAAAGVTAAVLLYLLVYPYAGTSRARLAVALFVTTYGVFWESRTVQMDILVLVTTLAVVLAVTRVVDHGLSPWVGWSLAGAAAGLGFLAKGPVSWVCPGITLLAYLVVTRRWKRLLTPAVPAGALLALILIAPWAAALYLANQTEYLKEMLIHQNFSRFVESWDHSQPWYYYGKYYWVLLAPWSWFVPLAIAVPDRDPDERRLDLLSWCWILGIVIFFSMSDGKRAPYILPIAPAVAVLVSGVAQRLFDGRLSRGRAAAALTLCGMFGVLGLAPGLAIPFAVLPDYPELGFGARVLAATLITGGLAVVVGLGVRRRRVVAPAALLAMILSLWIVAAIGVLPAANAYKSARPFCNQVLAVIDEDSELRSFAFWKWRGEYSYYLDRTVPVLENAAALREYWNRPDEVFLLLEGHKLERARAVLGDAKPLIERPVGSRVMLLYSNRR
jgi:4-amino-4-deoxy-L-arabinose transferase-like glycosyltransferase